MSWRDQLPEVAGKLVRDESLAPYTWLRVGGPADVLFLPADEADLQAFLRARDPSVPVTAVGVGSNLLVRDGGVEGVVPRGAEDARRASEGGRGARGGAGGARAGGAAGAAAAGVFVVACCGA